MNVLDRYARAIDDLKEANRQVALANLNFAQVFAAKMEDLAMIPQIYRWYRDCATRDLFCADGTANKKQFVFLVLKLYSPASLVGGGINKALRRAIAASLGIKADTAIYKMRSRAVFWYNTYPTFRQECNAAIADINRLLFTFYSE